jgi:16S rRNA (guanine966-N2)-methyltransferase
MRIIAGSKRAMKLLSPKSNASRPITDRVKESLFNVLRKYDLPKNKIVADLFCGVGSLGLEALSRGAEFVCFVEQDPKVAAILEKNIEKAGFVKQSKVIKANAFRTGALAGERRYDLIFIDPPYANTKDVGQNSPLGKLLSSIPQQLSTEGIVVVRTEQRTQLLKQYGKLEIIEQRQWGTMAVTILQKKTDD